jgi:hypothetical protein
MTDHLGTIAPMVAPGAWLPPPQPQRPALDVSGQTGMLLIVLVIFALGLVRLPIERAMELLLERGLPTRPQTEPGVFRDTGRGGPGDASGGHWPYCDIRIEWRLLRKPARPRRLEPG